MDALINRLLVLAPLVGLVGNVGCAVRSTDSSSTLRSDERPLPPVMPVEFRISGFDLSPGRSCDNGWIDSSFCLATSPKSWTEEESGKLRSWLSQLPAAFLEKVRSNGFVTIYRYAHGFVKTATNGAYIRDEPLAWVWSVDKSVNISDFVFFASTLRDPISNYDFAQKTLVHELGHAYDNGSIGEDFLKLTGWQESGGKWALRNVDMTEVNATYAEVRRLGFEGLSDPPKLIEAMRLNRDFGIKHGFPTVYAMTNPSECFAEILAHVLVDPAHAQYLKPEVVEWFNGLWGRIGK